MVRLGNTSMIPSDPGVDRSAHGDGTEAGTSGSVLSACDWREADVAIEVDRRPVASEDPEDGLIGAPAGCPHLECTDEFATDTSSSCGWIDPHAEQQQRRGAASATLHDADRPVRSSAISQVRLSPCEARRALRDHSMSGRARASSSDCPNASGDSPMLRSRRSRRVGPSSEPMRRIWMLAGVRTAQTVTALRSGRATEPEGSASLGRPSVPSVAPRRRAVARASRS